MTEGGCLKRGPGNGGFPKGGGGSQPRISIVTRAGNVAIRPAAGCPALPARRRRPLRQLHPPVLAKHQTGRRTQANALCRYVELARVTQVP